MKRAILFIIGIIFFIALFLGFDYDFGLLLGINNYYLILISAVFFVATIFIGGIRTKYLLKSLKEKEGALAELIKIEFISKFIYYLLPGRLNVPAKAFLLSNSLKASKGNTIALTSFEYALDAGVMVLFGLVGLSFFFSKLIASISIFSVAASIIVVALLAAIFFALPVNRFANVEKKVLRIKNKYLKKAGEVVFKLFYKIRTVWPKLLFTKNSFPVVFTIILTWLFSALSIEFIFLAYGEYVPILWVLTVVAVSLFIAGVSQIPGGVGARELSFVFLLSYLGVPYELSVAAALLSRIYTIIPMVIGYYFMARTKFGGKLSIKKLIAEFST